MSGPGPRAPTRRRGGADVAGRPQSSQRPTGDPHVVLIKAALVGPAVAGLAAAEALHPRIVADQAWGDRVVLAPEVERLGDAGRPAARGGDDGKGLTHAPARWRDGAVAHPTRADRPSRGAACSEIGRLPAGTAIATMACSPGTRPCVRLRPRMGVMRLATRAASAEVAAPPAAPVSDARSCAP